MWLIWLSACERSLFLFLFRYWTTGRACVVSPGEPSDRLVRECPHTWHRRRRVILWGLSVVSPNSEPHNRTKYIYMLIKWPEMCMFSKCWSRIEFSFALFGFASNFRTTTKKIKNGSCLIMNEEKKRCWTQEKKNNNNNNEYMCAIEIYDSVCVPRVQMNNSRP